MLFFLRTMALFVKTLETYLKDLLFNAHINHASQTAVLLLHNIAKTRNILPKSNVEKHNAFVF